MEDFFPSIYLQTIIRTTGGCLVVYRGQEAWFHYEEPTYDLTIALFGEVRGYAKILIGDARVFPNLEESTLISVDGEDFLVGDWKTPGDGRVVYIALKTSDRV
jgi:hypothetical protein